MVDPQQPLLSKLDSILQLLARCLWVAVAEILGSLVAAVEERGRGGGGSGKEKAAFPKGDLRKSKLLGVLRFGAREGGSLC